MQIVPFEQRPDAATWKDGPIYRIEDVFTVRRGQWVKGGKELGSVDDWAVDDYWQGAKFDGAGGDTHLFCMVLGVDGKPIPGKGILFFEHPLQADPAKTGFVERKAKTDGTENIPITGKLYYPDRGQRGDWGVTPLGRADALVGVGLPYNNHVSTFAVFRAYDAPVVNPPPPGPNPTPVTGDLAETNALLREIRDVLKAAFNR